jgi:PTH1 family peptidyl-tRNA hydrolase
VIAIIGLGNPGKRYTGTRHNIGFDIIDRTAEKLEADFRAGHGEYEIAEGVLEKNEYLLVKPLTWMNNSGIAVKEIADRFAVNPDHLLVISDDFHLPLGKLRLRQKGSDGGHNGLASVIYHLQTTMFPRLRCGIAGQGLPAQKDELKEYVLNRFEKNEIDEVNSLIRNAVDCVTMIITKGVAETQSRFQHNV